MRRFPLCCGVWPRFRAKPTIPFLGLRRATRGGSKKNAFEMPTWVFGQAQMVRAEDNGPGLGSGELAYVNLAEGVSFSDPDPHGLLPPIHPPGECFYPGFHREWQKVMPLACLLLPKARGKVVVSWYYSGKHLVPTTLCSNGQGSVKELGRRGA